CSVPRIEGCQVCHRGSRKCNVCAEIFSLPCEACSTQLRPECDSVTERICSCAVCCQRQTIVCGSLCKRCSCEETLFVCYSGCIWISYTGGEGSKLLHLIHRNVVDLSVGAARCKDV